MKKVRVGIIGAGFAARFHTHCYRRVAGIDVEVRAVAAAHPERARQFAADLGIPLSYDRVEDLLGDRDIDLVDICAPNFLHVPLVESAAVFPSPRGRGRG